MTVGLYLSLLLARGTIMLVTWVRQGWTALGARLKEWAGITAKAVVAVSLLMGLIPLMFGLLLELVVLTPVRVPLHQSPVYFLWQDWALGAMYTKITVALTFMGPDWWLKTAIEQLYQDGIRNLNLTRVVKVSFSTLHCQNRDKQEGRGFSTNSISSQGDLLKSRSVLSICKCHCHILNLMSPSQNLVVPSVKTLGLSLSLPYLLSHGLAPALITSPSLLVTLQRRIYPLLLLISGLVFFFTVQARQFKKLLEHIKNDRYFNLKSFLATTRAHHVEWP